MNFKEIVSAHLNEEEWRQRNTVDIEGLKKIQRELMRKYASENKQFTKDIAIQVAKEKNPDGKKKFVKYINNIFEKDNKLTYKEFVKRMAKKGTKKGDVYDINKPRGYEYTQVLKRAENIGINVVPPLKTILLKYFEEYPHVVSTINTLLTRIGHFNKTSSFIRYNKPSNKWIHISAVQTDFFNQVRQLASKEKKAKKMFSEILSKEEDSYKAMVSKLVRENPSVKYYTFSSPELAKRVERIGSEKKIEDLYMKLPKSLGFRKKNLTELKAVKKFDEDFFGRIKVEIPKGWIWFATKEMVNEDRLENNYISEMAVSDTKNIPDELYRNDDIIGILEKYIENIKERAKKKNKDEKGLLSSGADGAYKLYLKGKGIKFSSDDLNLKGLLFEYLYRNKLNLPTDMVKGRILNTTEKKHLPFIKKILDDPKTKSFLGTKYIRVLKFLEKAKFLSENILTLKKKAYKGDLEAIKELYSNKRTVQQMKAKDLSEKEACELIYKLLSQSKPGEPSVGWFIIYIYNSNLLKEKFMQSFRSANDKTVFPPEYFEKIYKLAKEKSFKLANEMLKNISLKNIFRFHSKFPEIKEKIPQSIRTLMDLKKMLKSIKVTDISMLNQVELFKDLGMKEKQELLIKSGYSQKEIDNLLPNKERTSKEKSFTKKIVGEENMLDNLVGDLVEEMKDPAKQLKLFFKKTFELLNKYIKKQMEEAIEKKDNSNISIQDKRKLLKKIYKKVLTSMGQKQNISTFSKLIDTVPESYLDYELQVNTEDAGKLVNDLIKGEGEISVNELGNLANIVKGVGIPAITKYASGEKMDKKTARFGSDAINKNTKEYLKSKKERYKKSNRLPAPKEIKKGAEQVQNKSVAQIKKDLVPLIGGLGKMKDGKLSRLASEIKGAQINLKNRIPDLANLVKSASNYKEANKLARDNNLELEFISQNEFEQFLFQVNKARQYEYEERK